MLLCRDILSNDFNETSQIQEDQSLISCRTRDEQWWQRCGWRRLGGSGYCQQHCGYHEEGEKKEQSSSHCGWDLIIWSWAIISCSMHDRRRWQPLTNRDESRAYYTIYLWSSLCYWIWRNWNEKKKLYLRFYNVRIISSCFIWSETTIGTGKGVAKRTSMRKIDENFIKNSYDYTGHSYG